MLSHILYTVIRKNFAVNIIYNTINREHPKILLLEKLFTRNISERKFSVYTLTMFCGATENVFRVPGGDGGGGGGGVGLSPGESGCVMGQGGVAVCR